MSPPLPNISANSPLGRSWQRCRANGLAPAQALPDAGPAASALRAGLAENAQLLACARPVIEGLQSHLAHSSSLVVLADRRGMVLHCAGDAAFAKRAAEVRLMAGAIWSEAEMGTNAIGTALIEKVPVAVAGSQHFLIRNRGLAGIGMPIVSPVGGVDGVFAIIGDAAVAQTHAAPLIELSVASIENLLVKTGREGAVLLRLHSCATVLGSPFEALALWSGDGHLLAWNRRFPGVCEVAVVPGLRFAECFGHDWQTLLTHEARPGGKPLALHTRGRRLLQARVDLRRLPEPRVSESAAALPESPPPGARGLEALGSEDPRMAAAIRRAGCIAGNDIPLLIEGETGTGKEWFAQAFHHSSKRREGPFIAVNCAAIPASLIEAELFGYLDGAFTGARRVGALGKIREAHGGTLFLDEIGDMPLALQAVLLRVLETRRVIPLGSMVEEAVDIGLVCASHHPLRQLVSRGMFRADLFFRLSGMTVVLPPLRERSDFEWVVRRMLAEEGRGKSICVAPESLRLLRGYSWPGNLRQLRNVLRLCVAMLGETGILTSDLLPAEISEPEAGAEHGSRRLQAVQVQAIQATLERHGGNISAAARELGITRTTLYRKLGAERPIAAAGS